MHARAVGADGFESLAADPEKHDGNLWCDERLGSKNYCGMNPGEPQTATPDPESRCQASELLMPWMLWISSGKKWKQFWLIVEGREKNSKEVHKHKRVRSLSARYWSPACSFTARLSLAIYRFTWRSQISSLGCNRIHSCDSMKWSIYCILQFVQSDCLLDVQCHNLDMFPIYCNCFAFTVIQPRWWCERSCGLFSEILEGTCARFDCCWRF